MLLVDLKILTILTINFWFVISLLTGIVWELGHLKVKHHYILYWSYKYLGRYWLSNHWANTLGALAVTMKHTSYHDIGYIHCHTFVEVEKLDQW